MNLIRDLVALLRARRVIVRLYGGLVLRRGVAWVTHFLRWPIVVLAFVFLTKNGRERFVKWQNRMGTETPPWFKKK